MKWPVFALPLLLGGCIHLGLPSLHKAAPPPPVAAAKPVCPGGLSAELQRQPLPTDPAYKGAAMVRPETEAESAAAQLLLAYMHDLAAWGRLGWARAGDAKAYCDGAKT